MRDGIAPYVDQSEPLGLARSFWSWDARLADFDNDGVPEALQASGFVRGRVDRWPELQELAMGNDNLLHLPGFWPHFRPGDDLSGKVHDPFFVRAASGRYFDIASELGMGDAQITRGIAIGDVDGDGRLDFVTANQWGDSFLFRNLSPGVGSFLGLDLRLPVETGRDGPGASLGRPAVGASVTVHLADGRRLVGQVDGGSGHSGKRAPTLHFGLGRLTARAASVPLRVDVRWRDASGTLRSRTLHLLPGWHRVLLDAAGPATAGQVQAAAASQMRTMAEAGQVRKAATDGQVPTATVASQVRTATATRRPQAAAAASHPPAPAAPEARPARQAQKGS
jgi:hypothetical protein